MYKILLALMDDMINIVIKLKLYKSKINNNCNFVVNFPKREKCLYIYKGKFWF